MIEIDYVGDSNKSVFTYDGAGHRVVDAETVSGTTTTTHYLWCGSIICQTRTSDDVVTRRDYAEGEQNVTTGQKLIYMQDQLGSVRDVIDGTSGALVAAYDYGPYGNVTRSWGTVTTDYQYAGLYAHVKSGLMLATYRALDPNTGRWINRDPIRERGGINLYSYSGGNPENRIDPLGLYANVQVNKNNVTITIPIQYMGPGATPSVIQQFNNSISSWWSGQYGPYTVTVKVIDPPVGAPYDQVNTFYVPAGDERANVCLDNHRQGWWPANSQNSPGWVAAREAGHLMGLDDYYDRNTGVPLKPGDIMAEPYGVPDLQDIKDIIRINSK